MKRISLFGFCLIFTLAIQAQNLEWYILSNQYSDTPKGYKTTIDKDDNIFVISELNGYMKLYTSNGDSIFLNDQNKKYVYKTSPEVDIEWIRTFSNFGAEGYVGVLNADSDGNLYVAGQFWNQLIVGTGGNSVSLSSAGTSDGFIIKYSPHGDVLAIHQIGGPMGLDKFTAIYIDDENNVFLAGHFKGDVDFDLSENQEILSNPGVVIAKYTSDLELIWVQQFPEYFQIDELYQDENENFIIAGSLKESFLESPENDICTTSHCSIIQKLNPDFDSVWKIGLNQSGAGAYSLLKVMEKNDNIYFTGNFTQDFVIKYQNTEQTIESSSNHRNIFLGKINSIGNVQWVKTTETNHDATVKTLIVNDQEEIHLCGSYSGSIIFDPNNLSTPFIPTGKKSAFVSVFNANGVHMNTLSIQNQIASEQNDPWSFNDVHSMSLSSNNEVVLHGFFNGILTTNPTLNFSAFSVSQPITAYIAKLGDVSVNVEDYNFSPAFLIYPNPSQNEVHISGADLIKIEIYDLSGKLLKTEIIQGSDENYILQNHHLVPGVYMVSLTANGGFTTTQKMIIAK